MKTKMIFSAIFVVALLSTETVLAAGPHWTHEEQADWGLLKIQHNQQCL